MLAKFDIALNIRKWQIQVFLVDFRLILRLTEDDYCELDQVPGYLNIL